MAERTNRVPPREDGTLFHIWQFTRITRTTSGSMLPTASNPMCSRYLSCQADRPPWPRLASNTMAAGGGAIGARDGQVRHDRRKVQ
ncbi:uncharacterized protein LMH87_009051 [Akanthomyces muscarius]|uniref:Uncharacterized protein n=1 Tax=Akanthomyces muscarius TaxID=2231603 RepID=A0A9W8UP01_AKAMU|nr:uncharacterized protein LMH87_009051 [Akanthomyces muscarius]KAJ4158529.1 hypothetical protein LMH87_009051 [Akanthomyces muscarius]